ncbi:MAG: ParB/RepB/Spo0J family partition protein [Candidatus Sericytochromatia bacterium]|nr:ParB/RepB/Spo0J family partition protein [Candidatus Sericytochromatia bacterium]
MQITKQTINMSEIIKAGQKVKVDISQIIVPQYHDRTDVDDDNIISLTNSMSEVGQLNPILLDKKADDHFELISGLRRYEAALKLNWSQIDAITFENLDDQGRLLIMIAENAQRQDLNDYDLVNSLVHFLAVSTSKSDDDVKAFLTKLKNHDAGNVKSLDFDEKKLKKTMEDTLIMTDRYSLKNLIAKLKVLNFNPKIIKAMQEHKVLFSYAFLLNKVKDENVINDLLTRFTSKQLTKVEFKKEIRKAIGKTVNGNILPFDATIKKLKDYSKLPEEKKNAISDKMKEIDSLLAS